MRKNRLFASALMVAMVMFISNCGGGGGNSEVRVTDNHEYVVENLSLNLAEPYFWSDNGSVWKVENREVDVFQDGKPEDSQLEWDNFSVKDGDRSDFTIEGLGVGGGEVSLRVVEKKDGKTTFIHAEEKFIFNSGKNIVPVLISGTNDNASVILMFGKKAGKYIFSTNHISIKRTRVKTIPAKTTTLDIGKGKFGSDSGSIWDPAGILKSIMGSQRASTKLEWEGIPIKANVVFKIVLTGYSMPVSNVVIQLRSVSGQTLGERIVEFYCNDMVVEIVPTGTDAQGSLRILFGLSAGTYQLEKLRIETE